VISHEVGHNWFFGMIGNNETYRASLDEGFTQFLTSWSLKKINPQSDPLRLDDNIVFNRYFQHVNSSNSATLNTHSDHFNSAERHGGGYSQVYFKTATMLYNLEQVLGEELFLNAMKHYVAKWKIGHPYWADFRKSIIEYTHVDLNWFFDGWIEKNYTIDYAVSSMKRDATGTSIELKRLGKMSMPLEIGIIDENGAEKSFYIPNSYFVKKTDASVLEKWVTWDELNTSYTFHVRFKAKEVIIDPRGRVADVNRLNNSSKTPISFKYDRFKKTYGSHRSYTAGWHPQLWYNHIDGLKVGINSHGNYFNTKHVLDVDAYYNTGVTFDPDFEELTKKRILFNYQVSYSHQLNPDRYVKVNSAVMDGALWNELSYMLMGNNKNTTTVSVKTIGRPKGYLDDYALRPSEWNEGMYNTSVNLKWSHPYRYFKGNGRVNIDLRNAGLFSDYRYGWLRMETVNKNKLGKWKLNTRLFAAALSGNVAPESALKLDGGNSEDMLSSGIARSPGFFQQNEASYGQGFNVFHQAGGLNVRGNAGYRATTERNGSGVVINTGNAGAAFNAELDFTDVIKLNKFNRKSPLKFNTYLFSDAGVMALDLKNLDFNSGLRVDAGAGTLITFSSRKFNVIKPLRLRVDFPVFINRLPFDETDYFAFRYIVGVGKVIN
jgi:aminopeptidase N